MVFPPAYGGYRHEPAHSDAHLLYSPPHAGVIGEAADGELGPVRIPPARGGNTIQPVLLGTGSADNPRVRGLSVPCTKTLVVATYSPRMRGLLAGSDFAKQVQGVFPPLAGVIGA